MLLSRFYLGGGQSEFRTADQHQYPNEAYGGSCMVALASPLRDHINVRAVAAFRDLESYQNRSSLIAGTIRSVSVEGEIKLDLFEQDSRPNFYVCAGFGLDHFWWQIDSLASSDVTWDGSDGAGEAKARDDRLFHSICVGTEIPIIRTFGIFIEWRQSYLHPLRDDIRIEELSVGLFM